VKLDVPEFTKDFKLRQGVWIHGRTVDDRTREPVTGPVQYLAYIDNPELKKSYPGIFRSGLIYERRSDENGRFAIAVPPGKGVLTFTADDHTRFRRGVGGNTLTGPSQEMPGGAKVFQTAPLILMPSSFHIVREINIPAPAVRGQIEGAPPPQEITLPLTSGVDVVGTIVDPDGKPLAGAVYVVDRSRVHALDIPFTDALKTIWTWTLVTLRSGDSTGIEKLERQKIRVDWRRDYPMTPNPKCWSHQPLRFLRRGVGLGIPLDSAIRLSERNCCEAQWAAEQPR
jgi:hypothetical protein